MCYSSLAYHLDGKKRAGYFTLFSWCLVIAMWLFLTVSWVGLQYVIVVFTDHTPLLFGIRGMILKY